METLLTDWLWLLKTQLRTKHRSDWGNKRKRTFWDVLGLSCSLPGYELPPSWRGDDLIPGDRLVAHRGLTEQTRSVLANLLLHLRSYLTTSKLPITPTISLNLTILLWQFLFSGKSFNFIYNAQLCRRKTQLVMQMKRTRYGRNMFNILNSLVIKKVFKINIQVSTMFNYV